MMPARMPARSGRNEPAIAAATSAGAMGGSASAERSGHGRRKRPEAFTMRPVTPGEQVPPAPIFKEPAEEVPFVAEDDVHRELIDEVKEPNGADREDYGQSKRAQERTVCREPSLNGRPPFVHCPEHSPSCV